VRRRSVSGLAALVLAGLVAALALPVAERPRSGEDEAGETMVLALSWLPAFCEGAPGRPECRLLGPRDRAARGFTLHGLWPGPRGTGYCGRAGGLADRRWSALPEPEIDAATRAALAEAMPGMRSHLHRHQWAKHGSCYPATADEYFDDALYLLGQVDRSAIGDLFRERIGRDLSAAEIRGAADRAFGTGAGARVSVVCRDGLIVELRLSLRGRIDPDTALGDLLAAGERGGPGCARGHVDPA